METTTKVTIKDRLKKHSKEIKWGLIGLGTGVLAALGGVAILAMSSSNNKETDEPALITEPETTEDIAESEIESIEG